jgi:hypothetical protein
MYLFVEFLDGVPVEVEVLGDILDGGVSTVASDADGEALGEVRVVGEPFESFAFHGIAPPTCNATDGELQVDASPAAVEIAGLTRGLIVEGVMDGATLSAGGFLRSRRSGMTAAERSPKTPWMCVLGTNPGKA